MSDKHDDWSLRKEINKRRTQQTPSAPSEPQRTPPQTPSQPASPPAATPAARQSPVPPPARRTSTASPVPLPIKRTTREMPAPEPEKPRRNTRPLVYFGFFMAVVLVGALVVLLSGVGNGAPAEPTLSYSNIKFTAADVVEYLRRAGVPISDLQALSVPNETLSATQGYQFLVVRGDQFGVYIVLSYDPEEELGRNAVWLSTNEIYKTWRTFTAANIRVMYRPNNSPTLDAEMDSHLTSLLVAPYRAMFPTTTGTPFAAAFVQTLTAQPTPTRPIVTATRFIVTLSPEERATADFTPQGGMFDITVTPQPTLPPRDQRPTITPLPTRTPISAGFSSILTRAPGQPTLSIPGAPTATPEVFNTPTATPFGTQPPTVPPGVIILNQTPVPVAILPTVAPQVENSASFNDRAPRFVDPFRLIPEASTTNQYGSTLIYTIPSGAQYLVVLWITNSPDEAYQRYNVDLAAINGYQQVPVGEAGIVTAPQNYVMAMAIRANMVLIIYRPPEYSTVPSDPVSQDQVVALLKALYEAIPVN
ncbi:MAG: hypothetical protein DYG88_01705 [Chloroflexi bacterium CFX4]|nr:hypothetical protein [Chloroflexi bacterium CFX4]MDL1921386.1 hypothetical protein [Chloroflexi bacterium CFX3]